jgi:uncharacterized DUF497 family protein
LSDAAVSLDVGELAFDDENEAKLAAHGVTIEEVLQVLDGAPRFFGNRRDRRATHVMLGPTFGGRLLVVPLEEWGSGIWRPVTAFDADDEQRRRYRS